MLTPQLESWDLRSVQGCGHVGPGPTRYAAAIQQPCVPPSVSWRQVERATAQDTGP